MYIHIHIYIDNASEAAVLKAETLDTSKVTLGIYIDVCVCEYIYM